MTSDTADGRATYLQSLELLDAPPESPFDRLTHLAARLLDAPVALVSIVDRDRQYFLSRASSADDPVPQQTHITRSFCKHVVELDDVLVVQNSRENPLVRDNPAVDEYNVSSYLGVPLRTSEGYVLGSLCCIDRRPREWSDDQVSTLQDLAASVVTEVEYRSKTRALGRLEEKAARLGPLFDQLGDLLAALQARLRPGDDEDLFSLTVQASTLTRRVAEVARDVSEGTRALPPEDGTPDAVDLRRAVSRAVATAAAVYGPGRVVLEEGPERLPLGCYGNGVQEGLVRLVSAVAALSADSQPTEISVVREGGSAEVRLWAPAVLPAPALMRVLSSLAVSTCAPLEREGIQLRVEGAVTHMRGENVQASAVEGSGTTVAARFPLVAPTDVAPAPERPAAVPARAPEPAPPRQREAPERGRRGHALPFPDVPLSASPRAVSEDGVPGEPLSSEFPDWGFPFGRGAGKGRLPRPDTAPEARRPIRESRAGEGPTHAAWS